MVMNRREFIASSVAGAALLQQGLAAFGDPVENLPVTIDATKCSGPVSPLVFGGYMEPATTRVWAEMLGDRKFARTIVSSPPMPSNPFFRRFMGEPWLPIGPEDTVEMDTVQPWVGAHSPRIKLTGSAERGIKQSGLRLGSGRSYVGRIYLAGNSGARIEVRLVWGTGASDSQVISIPTLSSEYQKFPLKFMPTANAEDRKSVV